MALPSRESKGIQPCLISNHTTTPDSWEKVDRTKGTLKEGEELISEEKRVKRGSKYYRKGKIVPGGILSETDIGRGRNEEKRLEILDH